MNDDIYNTDGFIIKNNSNNNNNNAVNNDDIYNTDGFVVKNNSIDENNDNIENIDNEDKNINDENNNFNFTNVVEPKKEKNYDEQIEFESDMVKGYIGDNYNKFNDNKLNIYAFFLGGVYLIYRKKYIGILLFLLFFTLFYNFYSNIFILIALILLYFLVNYYIAKSFNEKYMNKAYDECMQINEEYKNRSDIEIIRICRAQGGVSAFFTILLVGLIIAGNVYFGPILKDKFSDIFGKDSNPTPPVSDNVPTDNSVNDLPTNSIDNQDELLTDQNITDDNTLNNQTDIIDENLTDNQVNNDNITDNTNDAIQSPGEETNNNIVSDNNISQNQINNIENTIDTVN